MNGTNAEVGGSRGNLRVTATEHSAQCTAQTTVTELTNYSKQRPLRPPQPPQPSPHHPLILYPPLPWSDGVALQRETRAARWWGAAGVCRLAREQVEVDGRLRAAGSNERLGRMRMLGGGRVEGDGGDGGELAVVWAATVGCAVVRMWPAWVRVRKRGRRRRLCGEDRIV